MKTQHPSYLVKEGDTKQVITDLFGIEEAIWVRYHNARCRLEHVIKKSLPEDLTNVYLLPELWDKARAFNYSTNSEVILDVHNEKVVFGIYNSIHINQIPQKRLYRVKIEYLDTNSRIDFEILAEKIDRDGREVRMKFYKDNFFINRLEPDLLMDEIAVKVAKSIYPVCLNINYLDARVKLENPEQMYDAWPEVRQEIEKEYIGETIQAYLDKTEASMLSKDLKNKLINNDVFFGLFTHSIYAAYHDSLEIDSEMRLSLGAYNSTLNFNGKQSVDPTYNNVQGIYVRYKGYAEVMDFKIKEKVKYELNIKYNLEYKTFSIKDILAEIVLHSSKGKKLIQRVSVFQQRNFEKPINQ